MKNATIISPAEYISMPWRNGAGSTVELLKRELPNHSTGEFLWRLSMADVVENGSFSTFNNYDRTLVLLAGQGITLRYDDLEVTLIKPLQLARFKGESTTIASIHEGPIKDFNIMTRRGLCYAKTTCSNDSKEMEIQSSADTLLVFVVKGFVAIDSDAAEQVTAQNQSLILLEPPPKTKLRLNGPAFIVVEIFQGPST